MKIAISVALVAAAIALSSCQRGLSRDDAAGLIERAAATVRPRSIYLNPSDAGSPRAAAMNSLEQLGYIKGLGRHITPTSKLLEAGGKVYESTNSVEVPVATFALLGVTGVRQEGTQASVEYQYEYRPTALGNELQKTGVDLRRDFFVGLGPQTTRARFELFDDGWRLVELAEAPK